MHRIKLALLLLALLVASACQQAPPADSAEPEPAAEVAQEQPARACGAKTKTGKACTRKVKDGGPCWQHRRQANR